MATSPSVLPRIMNRGLLNSNEIILIEERPAFLAVIGPGLIIWSILGTIIFFPLAVSPLIAVALFLWILLVGLPILIRVLKWRRMFYALSNQRLMQGSGVIGSRFVAFDLTRTGGMIDVSTYRITGVAFKQGFLGRIAGFGDISFNTNRGNILWKGIEDPLNIRRIVEEKVSTMQTGEYQHVTYTDEIIKRTAQIRTDQSFGYLPQKEPTTNMPNPPSQDSLGQSTFCGACGAKNSSESSYCSRCGSRLSSTS